MNMNMNRRTKFWAIPLVAIAVCLFSLPALAQSQTTTTAAGSGVFPTGAVYNGVSLSALSFGMGVVQLSADGTASGSFESTLVGNTLTGDAKNIVVMGNASSGSGRVGGPATYTGTCTVNLGDGTPPLTGVPFTVTVATVSTGNWGLTLSLGDTHLPTAGLKTGSVTIK